MSRSIYQSNGKPLSQQALYQQKLKQGIFTTPGIPSVGVNSSASDTAALLAASADLTVKPSYERTIAKDAHTAALAAKHESITTWSRDSTDSLANSAASSAKLQKLDNHTAKYTGVPNYKADAVFKLATSNSTSTMTSRTTPEKLASKHGLQVKNSSSNNASSGSLNIGKISQVANKNSTKSLNSRFNPTLDYRSGLLQHQKPTEYLNQSEEDLAAQGATASLKHGAGYTDQVSSKTRSKSFKAIDVVDATLLAAASAKANERLQTLNSSTSKDFKSQAQQYANALTIAQKNSEERIRNHQAGLVNLGGGLTMAQSELDKLASLIVQPVINDINSKASLQRETDLISKGKREELVKKHNQSKIDAINAKNKQKQEIEQAKLQRVQVHNDKKKTEDENYVLYQTNRNQEVDGKLKDFELLKKKHLKNKEALITEKKEDQDRIDQEEEEFIQGRKTELNELQAEKDEILSPILDELKEENKKLDDLTNAKNELVKETESSEATNKEYNEKIDSLSSSLAKALEDIKTFSEKLEETTTKHDEASKTVDDLHLASEKQLKEHEDKHKELDGQIAELEATKDDHLETKKLNKQLVLDHIDERVKDEHAINNELPDHLKKDIDESKLRDTGDLFSIDEPKHKEEETKNASETSDELKPKKTATFDTDSITELSILDSHTKKAAENDKAVSVPIADEEKKKLSNPKAKTEAPRKAGNKTVVTSATAAAASSPNNKKKGGIRSRISGLFSTSPKTSPVKSKFDEPTATSSKQAGSPTKKPVTTKTTKPEVTKKEASTKTPEATASSTAPASSSTDNTTSTKETTSTGATSTKPSAKPDTLTKQETNIPEKDRSNSEVSNADFEDDISIDKNKNQGGLFKEEI